MADEPESKEVVVYAFTELPVRIIWISRDGVILKAQVVEFNDAEEANTLTDNRS